MGGARARGLDASKSPSTSCSSWRRCSSTAPFVGGLVKYAFDLTDADRSGFLRPTRSRPARVRVARDRDLDERARALTLPPRRGWLHPAQVAALVRSVYGSGEDGRAEKLRQLRQQRRRQGSWDEFAPRTATSCSCTLPLRCSGRCAARVWARLEAPRGRQVARITSSRYCAGAAPRPAERPSRSDAAEGGEDRRPSAPAGGVAIGRGGGRRDRRRRVATGRRPSQSDRPKRPRSRMRSDARRRTRRHARATSAARAAQLQGKKAVRRGQGRPAADDARRSRKASGRSSLRAVGTMSGAPGNTFGRSPGGGCPAAVRPQPELRASCKRCNSAVFMKRAGTPAQDSRPGPGGASPPPRGGGTKARSTAAPVDRPGIVGVRGFSRARPGGRGVRLVQREGRVEHGERPGGRCSPRAWRSEADLLDEALVAGELARGPATRPQRRSRRAAPARTPKRPRRAPPATGAPRAA